MDSNEKREVTTVNLRPDAREMVDNLREDTGVPKTEAVSRILDWFTSLPVTLRTAVLNRDPDSKRQLVKLFLAEMAADDGEALPASEGESIKLMRRALSQLERIHAGRSRERAGIEPGAEEKKRPRKG